ncbi:MAG: hypothetical protein WA828_16855 [Coleofasciculaceae cyanobacterium]
MKLTSLFKTVCTIGLVTVLSAIEGMSTVQTAQSQVPKTSSFTCSDAYFEDPSYMYSPVTQEQRAAVAKFAQNPARVEPALRMMEEITTFSVPLDSPLGYAVKKVNGQEVAIPPQIRKEIDQAVYREASPENRRLVAQLNQKYGQYATFGQNITLLLSPEQVSDRVKEGYELNAYIKSLLTPQQMQEQREALKASGPCSSFFVFKPELFREFSIDVGVRPDLDKRLREDTSGTTFFK